MKRLVLVGRDKSVFKDKGSGTLLRHKKYIDSARDLGWEIKIDLVIVGSECNLRVDVGDGLRLFGLKSPRVFWAKELERFLIQAHEEDPISLVSTQAPFEEAIGALRFCSHHSIPFLPQLHLCLFSYYWLVEHPLNFFRFLQGLWTLKSSKVVRTVSPMVPKWLGVDERTVPVAVDDVFFEISTVGSEDKKDEKIVLFVGTFYRPKNLSFFVKVIEKVFNLGSARFMSFYFVGSGPQRDLVRSVEKKHAERVKIIPYSSSLDLVKIYRRASVLFLPSTYEAFGRVIVEAGLCGVPTVAFRSSGPSYIIEDGRTGILFDSFDPVNVARILLDLLNDDARRKAMGERAREVYRERFAPKRLREDLVRLWREIVEG